MKREFGNLKNHNSATLYTLENEAISFSVSNYGATLVSFVDKNSGIDVVLGYDDISQYEANPGYLGAMIGRVANRIENGLFTLNGKTYQLVTNDRGNHLHGGLIGFDKVLFEAEEKDNVIIFTYQSKDGEEGYPGNLSFTVTYTLLEDGISIETNATSDQDTVFATTNHAYFNVDGKGEVFDQVLTFASKSYCKNDQNALTLEGIYDSNDTVFDFSTPTALRKGLESDDEQILLCGGYDHHFPVEGEGIRKMVECKGEKLTLTMESDYPGFHMYVANFEKPLLGKNGQEYIGRASVCFEAEYYPNAINYDTIQPKPIVRQGQKQTHTIIFRLKEN